jgi:hypothetical protein
VLEKLAPAALEGTGKLAFARTGLVWTLEVSRGVFVEVPNGRKDRTAEPM